MFCVYSTRFPHITRGLTRGAATLSQGKTRHAENDADRFELAARRAKCSLAAAEGPSVVKTSYKTPTIQQTKDRPTGARREFRQDSPSHRKHPGKPGRRFVNPPTPTYIPIVRKDRINDFFQSNVAAWARNPPTVNRLVSYGLPVDEARTLLKHFVKDVQDGVLSEDAVYYGLERFAQPHDETSIDVIYSTIFFSWTAKTSAVPGVHANTLVFMRRLLDATSRPFPADEWPFARKLHRKIIMHVGPTNSGKTHHALRALAAAPYGVYAAPLRLLAHEIFLRLNNGEIMPLGADGDPHAPGGNPQYARECNMVTGEEQKVVVAQAGLVSCTVEMLSYARVLDVAVIDEIQMIADKERGGAWTQAVLGIAAREVHLCGEETAVPIVQALLADTGDEVEVRRYERLTPLVVEEDSLNGDLTKIQKGDCVVTFSRSSIFALKRAIEVNTGMRCAVVYGRLPPEVRSEQAALFNDPNSGYDVIVGSDAIGMGLNLKIKRVVFASTSKWNGSDEVPLAVSSVKQIAGRAGRFTLEKGQAERGGTTTTLFPDDLPHLIHCLKTPYTPLACARATHTAETITGVLSVLPPKTPMEVVLSAPKYIGRLPPYIRYAAQQQGSAIEILDNEWQHMSNGEKAGLLYAPIPWRDTLTVELCKKLLAQQARHDPVIFMNAIIGTEFMERMEIEEQLMQRAEQGESIPKRSSTVLGGYLLQMESLHKVMVLYMWMYYRNTVTYPEGEYVTALKERLERVLNWTLVSLSEKMNNRKVAPKLMALLSDPESLPKTPSEQSGEKPDVGQFAGVYAKSPQS